MNSQRSLCHHNINETNNNNKNLTNSILCSSRAPHKRLADKNEEPAKRINNKCTHFIHIANCLSAAFLPVCVLLAVWPWSVRPPGITVYHHSRRSQMKIMSHRYLAVKWSMPFNQCQCLAWQFVLKWSNFFLCLSLRFCLSVCICRTNESLRCKPINYSIRWNGDCTAGEGGIQRLPTDDWRMLT